MSDNSVDKAGPSVATVTPDASGGSPLKGVARNRRDVVVGVLIFIFMSLAFWFAPVHQVTDSSYSMLLSQSLWQHQSFALDQYAIPRMTPLFQDNAYKNGDIYQLELVRNHLYYFFPPGSSVLSVPFVFVLNQFGISAVKPDGSYDLNGEIKLEAILAALLMAAASVMFFLLARVELSVRWSVMIALGAALGTQVWSTASRAMWSDTWGVLISTVVIYFLLAPASGRREIKPVLLATLLAWSYFVRPTSSIAIIGVTAYMFFHHQRHLVRFLITGAAWLFVFAGYSWIHFGKLLPNYYSASRLNFQSFGLALLGHLISPSRGLLVYTPALLFLIYLLVRYRRSIAHRRLVWLALFVMGGHLVVISGFDHWWGGFCYGSRLTTGLVPWLVLLAVVGIKAMVSRTDQATTKTSRLTWAAQLSVGAALVLVSIFINARGAIARETWLWNVYPVNVDRQPERLWSWRDPQMLAGLVQPPLPKDFPPASSEINFVTDESARYLWYGWSGPETEARWTDGTEAALIFSANQTADIALQIKLAPFVDERRHPQQRVNINLNGQLVQRLTLTGNAPQVHEIILPRQQLQQKNILTFELPDARTPKSLGINDDLRVLGIAVWWIRFSNQTNLPQIANRAK